MKKKLTRLFSVLLAAVLVLGTLPVSAMGTDVADPPASAVDDTLAEVSAAEPEEASVVDETPNGEEAQSGEVEAAAVESIGAVEGYDMNIFFLDCGRKYYSVDSIKKLIDNAKAAGFNYIQLAVGNDGMRLLLDDMSLTVGDKTYSSDAVKTAVHNGNVTYDNEKSYITNVDELTQSQMNEIIAYAQSKKMGVIPCVNTPGHMDAILAAASSLTGTNCSYSGSVRTIDVTNATATAFTKAFLQKYITYFSNMGCKYFNMGADEYANDIFTGGSMGFGNLQYSGKYSYYVDYVNQVAGLIKNAGMKPMAFNDGIYFQSKTSYGTFDTDIIVCYWSNGWPGYTPMPASTLASKGFKLINTNGDYYWVLGANKCTAETAKDFSYEVFAKQGSNETLNSSLGSMFCIWADNPGELTEAQVIENSAATIAAFGNACPQVEDVTETAVTPPNPDNSELIITAPEGANELKVGSSVTLNAGKTATWSVSQEGVVALSSADDTVTQAANTSVNAQKVKMEAVAAGKTTITATSGDQKAEFSVEVQEAQNEKRTINVTIGQTATDTFASDTDYSGENYTTDNTDIATVEKVEYKQATTGTALEPATFGEGEFYVSTTANDTNPTVKIKIVKKSYTDGIYSGEGYFIVNDNGENVYPYYSRLSTSTEDYYWFSITKTDNDDGSITLANSYYGNSYLTISNDALASTYQKTSLYLYKEGTAATEATNTVTFKGVSKGTAYVTIGNIDYTINVTEENLTQVTPLTIEYWITNSRLTGTTSNKDALTIKAASAYSEDGLTVADLVDPEGTKDSRTQEYWKNVMLDTQKENSSTSETELQTTKQGDDETLNGTAFTKVRYWGGKWQVYTTDWVDVNRTQVRVTYQNDQNATETYSGDKNQLVAYYMEVVNINNANGESELHVNAADWGTKGDGTGKWGYTPESNRCSVSVQLVYEDSTKNPANTTADALKSKTIVYNYWAGGRGLGTMVFTGKNNYEIYKITAETGNMESTTSGQTVTVTSFTWDKNEEVVWGGDDQEPSASASIGNPAKAPSYTKPYDNLAWNTGSYNKNNAILIRVYVKAKETPDSLHVHYIDATNGKNEEFYSYNINVNKGTTFDTGFALENGVLKNNTVTNNVGVTQTVESDLTKMTSIGTQYRYSKFTCKKAERDSEGKDVYLYYTFDDKVSYVVDFGTPVTIQPGDVNAALVSADVTLTSVTVAGANHGTVKMSGTTFTYTPDSRFVSSQEGETLTVTYTGNLKTDTGIQNGSKAYQVYIYPASNVLYEENFLTDADGWTKESSAQNNAQTTGKAKTADLNYGFDTTYSSLASENGVYKAAGLTTSTATKALTTSFYGNTFDLIGNCGTDTGRVVAMLTRTSGTKKVFIIDVDTRYNGGTIYQVPLMHKVLGDSDASYDVEIYASGLAENDVVVSNKVMAASEMPDGVTASDDILTQILADKGLTMDDVEYTSTSVAEELAESDASGEAANNVKLASEDGNSITVHHDAGTHVEIDSFRVYRSTSATDAVAQNYDSDEQNVTYARALDVVKNQIVAYTEANSSLQVSVQDYEAKGGPQNEIYLGKGQSIFFQSTKLANEEIQVSLRAVNTSATANVNSKTISLATNTEMYYTITADANGKVAIVNNTDALLAIVNVKLPENVTAADCESPSEAKTEDVVSAISAALYGDEEPEVFTPETFTAKTTVTPVVRNKMVTLKVNVSSDVAYITVNGVKYTRTGLQGLFQKTRTIRVVNTVKKGQTKTYEVVAYNADGVASETITVTG